jgi:peptidoglycan hydrolase CwlO-like protein
MSLTTFQKAQVRRAVGIHRSLQAANRDLYERFQAAQTELGKRKRKLDEVQEELRWVLSPGRSYSDEQRAKVTRESADRVAACERAIAEAEAVIADIKQQQEAHKRVMRPASELAESLISVIDRRDDGTFREEVTGLRPNESIGGFHAGGAA